MKTPHDAMQMCECRGYDDAIPLPGMGRGESNNERGMSKRRKDERKQGPVISKIPKCNNSR